MVNYHSEQCVLAAYSQHPCSATFRDGALSIEQMGLKTCFVALECMTSLGEICLLIRLP